MDDERLDILTPQGYLSEIMHHPNLEVVMNLFKIPRAFAVSGFGDWSVGRHSFCVAFLGLYWANQQGYDPAQRDRLVVMGLTHDLHESATGDILPALKNEALTHRLHEIQQAFLESLKISFDAALSADLKLLDMTAFLFEIRQAAVINQEQRERLRGFFERQRENLLTFAAANHLEGAEKFLAAMGLTGVD